MKKITKLIFSCAAVAAVTAALGTAALAANVTGDITGTYDAETGKLALTYTSEVAEGSDQTILILNADSSDVKSEEIEYVNQGASFEEGAVLPAGLETGKYYIRIGGDGKILTGVLNLDGDVKSTRLLGDVTNDNKINVSDVQADLRHYLDTAPIAAGTEDFRAGDVNKDEKINVTDVQQILKYYLGTGSTIQEGQTIDD